MSDIEPSNQPLEIVFENDQLIAINKPHGLLVHKTRIAEESTLFALQLLRDQIGRKVYPCHRLDRKTSGVLLFALDQETHALINRKFQNSEIQKAYYAIVRGHTQPEFTVDYPLTNDRGKHQDAITHFTTEKQWETTIPHYKYDTSRYSLVKVKPLTGRQHQIRKHLAHIMHPIVGDRPHGCNKTNRIWKSELSFSTMMLHASKLNWQNDEGTNFVIEAPLSTSFEEALYILDRWSIHFEK